MRRQIVMGMCVTCLLVLSTGCGREFPIEELGKIHTEIPYVEGVETPIKIKDERASKPRRRLPGRTADRVRIDSERQTPAEPDRPSPLRPQKSGPHQP